MLCDAAALFDSASSAIERIAFSSNFDSERLCSRTVERNSGEFANFPLQVVRLREFYPKRTRNRHVVTWIATTDLSLSAAEIREAAHIRWEIENNAFKRMSHLCGTERFWCKEPRAYFIMAQLFAAALAAFDAFISIGQSNSSAYNRIMQGRSSLGRASSVGSASICRHKRWRGYSPQAAKTGSIPDGRPIDSTCTSLACRSDTGMPIAATPAYCSGHTSPRGLSQPLVRNFWDFGHTHSSYCSRQVVSAMIVS